MIEIAILIILIIVAFIIGGIVGYVFRMNDERYLEYFFRIVKELEPHKEKENEDYDDE